MNNLGVNPVNAYVIIERQVESVVLDEKFAVSLAAIDDFDRLEGSSGEFAVVASSGEHGVELSCF